MIFLVIAVRRAFRSLTFPLPSGSLSLIVSLDDFGALFVQKLVAAIGAEKLDLFAPQLLGVAIEFTFTLRAGHPKNFRHDSFLTSETKSEIRSTKAETNSQSNKSQTRKIQNASSSPFRLEHCICLLSF
jgi:hypothetical protein